MNSLLKSFLLTTLLSVVNSQQPGHQKADAYPPLEIQTCTTQGGCVAVAKSIVMDSNWDWVHKAGTYTNCYTGSSWDKSVCPDPETCAQNCALDAGTIQDYEGTYGVTTIGHDLRLNFVTVQQYGTNVGSRVYLMENEYTYQKFKLLNQEFTFDVDASQLPCGLNGALYFVEMDADGGLSEYPGNQAGAAYGTGYCDAQCPHDIKFINGEANLLDWISSGASTGTGHFGTCCAEMDIWEANSISQAITPHPCNVVGQYRCNGTSCGDNSSGERYEGVCDKDGCDFNPYRLADHTFYGPGSDFVVDSTQPVTVVTQFITSDGTNEGDLVEIKRNYVQDGKVIPNSQVTLGGATFDSVTEKYCAAQKSVFGNQNSFADRGGLKAMGDALGRGMVLVMSLWDDNDVDMLWLDSLDPPTEPASKPGVARGSCSITSGKPADLEKNSPNAYVKYMNIKVGDIGSTTEFEV